MKTTLFNLAFYVQNRQQLAKNQEIRVTAGTAHEAALVNQGMEMAYRDILEWLDAHGIETTVCVRR